MINPIDTLKQLGGCRSALSRAILAGLVVAGSLGIDAAPVQAAEKVVIDAGYGGFAQPGRPFPATIQVTVDALFTGELRITGQNGAIMGTTRRIEVAGGTTRELTVIVESAPWGLPAVRVDLIADDTTTEPIAKPGARSGLLFGWAFLRLRRPEADLAHLDLSASWELCQAQLPTRA